IMTVDTFKRELGEAVKNYDRYVICLQKTPDEFEAVLNSLIQKAIKAYESRAAGMRHGIALDKEVTVILSQSDETRPLCGIYFNLHSPYKKDSLPKTVQPFVEKSPKTGAIKEKRLSGFRQLAGGKIQNHKTPDQIHRNNFRRQRQVGRDDGFRFHFGSGPGRGGFVLEHEATGTQNRDQQNREQKNSFHFEFPKYLKLCLI